MGDHSAAKKSGGLKDDWGNQLTGQSASTMIGNDVNKLVDRGLGGGVVESLIGKDGVNTAGDIAGGLMYSASRPFTAIADLFGCFED